MRRLYLTNTFGILLCTVLLLASGSAYGDDTFDWQAATKAADRASSPNDKSAAWGKLAYIHVRLAQYYKQLTDISAQFHVAAASRRAAYDASSVEAAVHAFIAMGELDSAANWAQRRPVLRPFVQFTKARASGGSIDYGSAGDLLTSVALAGLHAESDPGALSSIAGELKSGPAAKLVAAIVNNDGKAIVDALKQTERALESPSGVNSPQLDQFGDPLIYSAVSKAHGILAGQLCDRAAAELASSAPFFRFFGGVARFEIGDFAQAHDDLSAALGTNVAGIASAYLAGIEWRRGNQDAAISFASQTLEAERNAKSNNKGEALVALARAQSKLNATGWGTKKAADDVISANPDSRRERYAAQWANALLTSTSDVDRLKQAYWDASSKSKPDIRHGFANVYCAEPEIFCINYISALMRGGARGNGADYLDAYNGLMELARQIPATGALKEGLRWLSVIVNKDETTQTG